MLIFGTAFNDWPTHEMKRCSRNYRWTDGGSREIRYSVTLFLNKFVKQNPLSKGTPFLRIEVSFLFSLGLFSRIYREVGISAFVFYWQETNFEGLLDSIWEWEIRNWFRFGYVLCQTNDLQKSRTVWDDQFLKTIHVEHKTSIRIESVGRLFFLSFNQCDERHLWLIVNFFWLITRRHTVKYSIFSYAVAATSFFTLN